MERETMRSITTWLLLASAHQEPVPSQVTAAGSCAQVTRPGTTPRGTPSGESGSNKEDPMLLAAARERANCRRVISILSSLRVHRLSLLAQFPEGISSSTRQKHAAVGVSGMNRTVRQPCLDRQIVSVQIDRTCRN